MDSIASHTTQEFAPKMYSDHPASILVLPLINKTTAADAKEYYVTTLAESLTNAGYYVFPKVKIACDLLSTSTSDTLWRYHDIVEVNTSGSSGGAGGLAGLLVQAIATAIKTAATDYIPIAKDVNKKILIAMPYGKYHKEFDRDGKVVIEKKSAVAE